MFKNVKEGRLAALRSKVVAWWGNLQTARSPRLDLQVLEDRVLYSATPLPIEATGGGAESIDANLEQLDEALWNALGQPPASLAGTYGSTELIPDIHSVGSADAESLGRSILFLDESLANLDSLLQQSASDYSTAMDAEDHQVDELAQINNGVTSNSYSDAIVVSDVGDEGVGLDLLIPRLSNEVVFVQAGLDDFDALVADLQRNAIARGINLDVYALNGSENGFDEIGRVLSQYNELDAIHIVTHGADGLIQLGGSWLTTENVNQYQSQLQSWGMALADNGDILIYGCDVAATSLGQSLVESIAVFTGADVAASSDLTGHADLNGDWTLEFGVGAIETHVAFSASLIDSWNSSLIVATFQEGTSGYTGTADTSVDQVQPTTNLGGNGAVEVDLAGSSDTAHGLISFSNIFGAGAGQIPTGATITSATLTVNVTNVSDPGASITMHRMLASWTEASTWNSVTAGISADGVEAIATADSTLSSPATSGSVTFTGLASTVQAWLNGTATNLGWAILSNSTNGWDMTSSEGATVSQRPILTIAYTNASVATAVTVTNTLDNVNGNVSSLDALIANDGGDGISLREAIEAANNTTGANTINFNIAGTGVHTINVGSSLNITDAVTINATTDDSFAANGNKPAIELNGSGLALNGLVLAAGSDGSTIRGLVIQNFTQNGILVQSDGNTIAGNYIGLDADGTTLAANNASGTSYLGGIRIESNNNTIGGLSAADRNVISGNGYAGIVFFDASSNLVQGNYIGTDASGTLDRGNSQEGIDINRGGSNIIGGSNVNARNVISGNDSDGMEIDGSVNNVIQGNYIGTDYTGTLDLGNARDGIDINEDGVNASTGNLIGGTGLNEGNLIFGNNLNGIEIRDNSTTGNTILGNSIYGNTALGIELGTADGVTANDTGDGDSGANNLQNYAIIDAAVILSSTQLRVDGTLNSAANTNYRIEFFSNTTADASGYGEGATYLGFVDVLTNGSGNATFNTTLTGAFTAGHFITSTTTRLTSGLAAVETSEFSADAVVVREKSLWISSNTNATSSAGTGGLSYTDSTIVRVSDPNLAFGSGTANGYFTPVFDLDNFAGDGNTEVIGLHWVASSVTVGTTNAITLQRGDILFSTLADETFGGTQYYKEDIIRFRPTTVGDYSSGTFTLVLRNPTGAGTVVKEFALVETAMTVGGTSLQAGDFLLVMGSATYDSTVSLFRPTTMSTNPTGGSLSVLIDGASSGISFGTKISGLELVQASTTIGGQSLTAGQLLISLDGNDTVGTNNFSTTQWDIFALTVTATGTSTSSGSAAMFLRGSDVGLAAGGEEYDAIALVDAYNIAPVLDTAKTPALTAVNEDAGPPSGAVGTLISTLIDNVSPSGQLDNFSDNNADDLLGIAITAANTTNGTWWYTTNGGTNWSLLGTVSDAASRLLAADSSTRVYFQANTDYNGTVTSAITFRAWDRSSGTSGSTANTSASGGFTAFSSATDTANIVVNSISDLPQANDDDGHVTFDGTDDVVVIADSASLTMTNTLTMEAWINPTATANATRMIINKEGEYEVGIRNNTLQWAFANTTPGWNWIDTGIVISNSVWTHIAVSYDNGSIQTYVNGNLVHSYAGSGPIGDSHATLDELRIGGRLSSPATQYYAGSIDDVRIWNVARTQAQIQASLDQTLVGTETGLVGYYRFNQASGTTVTDLSSSSNHGVLTSGVTRVNYLTDEDTALVVSAGNGVLANDRDGDGNTLTVTALNVNGAAIGSATAITSGALVTLNSDGSYTYNANGAFNHLTPGASATDSFTYTVSDGTGNTSNSTVVIHITGVNDAPVLDNTGTMTFTSITEDQTSNSGQTVASIISSAGGDRITDVDGSASEGIAITATTSGNGSWEYSLNGTTWLAVNSVAENSALLLRSTDYLRFVPNGQNATTGNITFRAWDQTAATAGQEGTKVNILASGGSTAFSSATEIASITVTEVNDEPTLTTLSSPVVTVNEDAQATITLASLQSAGNEADVDGTVTAFIVKAVSSGTLLIGTSSGTATAWAAGTNDTIDATRQAYWTGPLDANGTLNAFTVVAKDDGGLESATPVQVQLSVTSVNDAPIRTAGSVNNLTVLEDSGFTSLGFGSLAYGPGGGVDESGQTITYNVTSVPSGIGGVYLADGTTLVTTSSVLTLTELQGLQFRTTTNASGTSAFQFNPTDSGDTANGGFNNFAEFMLITVTQVNDAPTLSASGLNPTFTEAAGLGTQAAAVNVFGSASVSTVESSQRVSGLTFTISGLLNGADEVIVVDGRTITLGANASGTTATNGLAYSSTVSGGTATIILSGASLTSADTQTLVNNITYQNTNTDNPTAGNRVVTLTEIKDNGGTANGGVDTTTLSIASTIAVTPVNDAAVITSNGGGLSASINLLENVTAVTTVTSTDVDGATPVYSLDNVDDFAKFAIDSSTGVLTFIAAPDFENQTDIGLDNVYDVTVLVWDGTAYDSQEIAVTIIDVSGTLVVTTDSDLSDGTVTSIEALNADKGGDGLISLREAIIAANSTAGIDTITFDLPGTGTHTIRPTSALPTITDAIVIDATSQAGYVNSPVIELDGRSAGAGVDGFVLGAGSSGSTIRGFAINRFAGDGIQVDSSNNTIAGNLIGMRTEPGQMLGSAIGWWQGDNNADDSVSSNTGTLQNGATYATGKLNQAFSFDGSNDVVSIAHHASLDATSAVTLDAWINPASFASGDAYKTIITKGDSPAVGLNYGLYVMNDGALYLEYRNTSNQVVALTTAAGLISTGQWANVTGVIDVTSNQMLIYVNGALVGTGATNGLMKTNTSAVMLGYNGASYQHAYEGLIDEAAIFNRALTSTEIAANYAAANGGLTVDKTSLHTWLRADGGTIIDSVDDHTFTNSSVTLTTGRVGQGMSFDGSSGLIASNPDEYNMNQLTYGFWFNKSGVTAYENLIGRDFTDGTGWTVHLDPTGQLKLRVDTSTFTNQITSASISGLNDGNWHFAAVTLDMATRQVTLSIDGGTASTGSYSGDFAAPTGGSMKVGSGLVGAGNYTGILDEIQIFNRVLSSGETNALYTNYSGTANVLGNATGVNVNSGTGNLIGGLTSGDGNVISGNLGSGVYVNAASTTLTGNIIGLNVSGSAAMSNGSFGVFVTSAGSDTTIGGTTASARNIISGNASDGVVVDGGGANTARNVSIQGNYIGTDLTGTADLGNARYGVYLFNGAAGNTVGGTVSGAGNVISGNTSYGVFIEGENNLVAGNTVGLNAAGTAAIANNGGVYINNVANNTIGGTTALARNVLSGNTTDGIYIAGTSASGNWVQGNYIGTNAAGTSAIANSGSGIHFQSSASGNTIGGSVAGAGNVISGNQSMGVFVSAPNNTLSGNIIGLNAVGNAKIANVGHGVYIASPGTGTIVGGTTALERNIISGNSNDGIVIDGAGLSTSMNVSVQGNYIGTDISGTSALSNSRYGIYLYNAAAGNTIGGSISSAGNVISGNTSSGIQVEGSSNTIAGNTIGLNAAGTATVANSYGVYINNFASNLIGGTSSLARNVISGNTNDGILVNGASTTGTLIQGNYIGTNASGTAALGNGGYGVQLTATSNGVTIGGAVAGAGNVISGNTGSGVLIAGSNSIVSGNIIGLNAAGTAALANGSDGIRIAGASNTTIGGTTASERNVISGNQHDGLWIYGGSSNSTILGNYIGLNAAGTAAIGNQAYSGIWIDTASNTTIGGSAAGSENYIAGSGMDGITITNAGGTTNTVIQRNIIGTDITGTATLGNVRDGIRVLFASGVLIGGTTSTVGNTIRNNGGKGINIIGSGASVTVQGNSIYGNTGQGIDLADDGISGNDGVKSGGEPNLQIDSPVTTQANLVGNNLILAGYVGSAANQSTFANTRVEFFISDNSSANGSGRTFLGFLTTDANGNFSGTLDVTGLGLLLTDKITGTATDSSGNTSEFGVNFDINVAPTAISDNAIAAEAGGTANGTAGTNPSGNVLSNDTDPDSADSKTVTGVVAGTAGSASGNVASSVTGSYGSINIAANGTYTYTVDNSNTTVQALAVGQSITDVFTYTMEDSGGLNSTTQITITIQGANDAPVEASIEGAALSYTENAGPVAITSMLTVTDLDDANIESAIVAITSNYANGQDILTFSNQNGISGSWNASTGELTLTGSATLAQYQAALRSITYTNTSESPSTATRTVSFTVNDGDANSNTQTRDIAITAINNTPDVVGPGLAYTVNEQTNLNIHGTGFSVTDIDAASGTVTATIAVGEGAITVAAGNSGVAISGDNGTGSVTVTGTLAQINNLLTGGGTGTIVYFNNSNTPSASTTITVTVNDGGNTGSDPGLTGDGSSEQDSAVQTINITAVNDTPDVVGPGSAYTVNEQTNLNIHGTGFSVTDVDAASGTVTATIAVGEGAITVAVGDSGVAIGGGNGTGSVSLTGTLAQINNLLTGGGTGTIVYFNNSNTPSASTTITVTVNDGGNTGADPGLTGDGSSEQDSAAQTINLTALNDDPTNAASLPSDITVTEDVASNVDLSAVDFSDVDAGSSNLTITLSTATGGQLTASSSGGVTVGGTPTARTFTGSLANLNTYFNTASNITYLHSTPHLNGNDVDTITVVINDNGNTGSGGGTNQTLGTVNVDITTVNDAPVLDNSGAMTFTSITEDQTTNGGQTVASIISGAGGDRITDADGSVAEGIAITATTNGNGSWEYSLDGTNWLAVGSVADNSALLLRSTDYLRFVPNGQNATSGDITFRAWDQTGATEGAEGTKVNISASGGSTAYSSSTEVASITVTAVNDAPTITDALVVSLTATNEDAPSPTTSISSLLTSAAWNDVDSGANQGIAVTGVTGFGTWEYSVNGGTSWTGFGPVSSTNALLLADNAIFRYGPNGLNGETAEFTFRAWDRTLGSASGTSAPSYADSSIHGSTTSFSSQSAIGRIVVSSVNDAAVANPDTASASEAGGYSNGTTGTNPTGNVLANDTDVDTGDTLAVVGVAAGVQASAAGNVGSTVTGTYGSIQIAANGAYTYTVDNNNAIVQALRTSGQSITDTFTYTIEDTSGAPATTQIAITITGANDAPTATVDSVTAIEAGGIANGTAGSNPTGNVLTNDLDVDSGDSKTVTGVVAGVSGSASGSVGTSVTGTYGSITIGSDGSFTFTVDNNNASVQALRTTSDTLIDVFSYTMVDAAGLSSTTQVSVTIQGANDAPIASDDNAAAIEAGGVTNGTAGSNGTGNVLTNDTDIDSGDTKAVTGVVSGAASSASGSVGASVTGSYGSVTINSDGSYTYLVDNSNAAVQALRTSAQTLSEVFTYTMQDAGGLSATATLTVTIQGSNDNPVAVGNTASALEAGGISNSISGTDPTGNVLTNDTDVDTGDTKTVIGVVAGVAGSASGSVGVSVSGSYGSIVISANGSFTYSVDNNNANVEALNNGQSLTDTFTYTMTDTAGATSTTTIVVTIDGADDLPFAVVDYDTSEEAGGVNNASGGSTPTGNVFTNDVTPNGNTLTGVAAGVQGSASGNVNTAVVGSYGSIVIDINGVYTYTLNNANAAVEALRVSGDHLTDIFTYTFEDSLGYTSSTQVTITIDGRNDNPLGVGDLAIAVEAGGVSNGTAGSNATGNVLSNDTDVDAGDTKSVSGVVAGPAASASGSVGSSVTGSYGSVVVNVDGTFSYTVNNTNAAVQALRTSSNTLTDLFTYTMEDTAGATTTATLTITIQGQNDDPIAVVDNIIAVEAGGVGNGTAGTNPSGNVLTNDTDVDAGDTKTVSGVAAGVSASASGSVGANVNGAYGAITIDAGGAYTYTVDSSNSSVQALRTSGQALQDVFTYTITDTAGATSTTQVTVTIQGANDAPVASSDSATATEAGGTANGTAGSNPTGNVLSNDNDVDVGDTMNVSGVTAGVQSSASGNVGSAVAGAFGSIQINSNGSYSYVVDNSNATVQALRLTTDTITDIFTYTVQDTAGATSTTQITITIQGANDAPVGQSDNSDAYEAGGIANATSGSNATGNVIANDIEYDSGDTTTVSGVAAGIQGSTSGNVASAVNGSYGSITIGANGAYTYTIDENNSAVQALRLSSHTLTDIFSYTIIDTAGLESTTQVTITVHGANDAPVAVTDNGVATEAGGLANGTAGSNASGNVLTNDTDVDSGDTKSVAGVMAGSTGSPNSNVGSSVTGTFGAITMDPNGNYTYVVDDSNATVQALRNSAQTLQDVFTYKIIDNAGLESTTQVTITIQGANDTPTAVADNTAIAVEAGGTNNGTAGSNGSGNVLSNDTDVDSAGNGETKTVSGVLAGVQSSASGNVGSAVIGSYGSINLAADGSYTYAVDNNNAAVQELRTSSQTLADVFTYTMTDASGLTSTTQVTVTIQGSNDAPVGANDSANATEAGGIGNGTAGSNASGNVLANDTDVDAMANGETKSVSGVVAGAQSSASGNVGTSVTGAYGSITINSDGSFTYLVDNSNATVQGLRTVSDSITDVFTYAVVDAGGLSSLATVNITITGQNDAPVISGGPDTSTLTETNAGLTDSGTFTVTDLDLTNNVTAAVDSVAVSGTGASSVPGSLTNAMLRGFLAVSPTAVLDGTQTSNTLTWNFNSGSEAFNFLATGETLVLTYTVSATDDDVSPLSNTETVTVTITGTGDAPVITGGPDTSSLTETNAGLTDSGTFTVTDLDLTDNVTAAVDSVSVSGTGASSVPGSLTNAMLRNFLTVNPTAILNGTQTTNTLTWNFNSGSEAFDFLASGETLVLTYTVSATDDDGSPLSDTETVTVTITGTGDTPVITGGPDTSSLTETNAGLTDSGTFTVTDLDLTDNVTAAVDSVSVSGTGASSVPGSLTNAMLRNFLTVTPTAILNGTQTTNTLTWNFNSGSEAFNFLATGETLVLTYTVSATDDDGSPLSDTETVTVTITGTGDAPVITGGPDTSSLTETNAGLTDSGTLTVTDLDLTDNVTAAVDSVSVSGTGVSNVPGSLTNTMLRNFLTVTPTAILNGTQTTNTLTWNFNSGSEAFNFLATGETLVLTYTVSATDDDGSPLSDTETVTVTITGTGDAPVITGGPDTPSLNETNVGLIDSGTLTVTDLDLTDNVTAAVDSVSVSGTGSSSVPGSLTNAMLRGFLTVSPTAVLDGTQTSNTLTWNFNSGSEAFNFLATGETLVLTYTVSATDDDGSPLSDTETVTVTITGTADAPVITGGPDTSSLTETNAGLTDSGTFTVTDLDLTDNVTAAVDSVSVSGTGASSVPGSLTNAMLRNFLTVTPTAILNGTQTTNTLTWNFNSGSEAFDFLATGETLVLTYTVSAIDDDGSPLSDTETVTVTITGTGDAPVITGGPDTSSLTETNAGLTDSGTFMVTDLDLTDNVTAAVDSVAVSGTGASSVPGSLTNAMLRNFLTVTPTAILNGTQTTNTLTWNFNSGSEAFYFLASGETLVLTYTVSATDDDGSPLSDTEAVTVTITGTGDAPVITGGPDTSSLTETNAGLNDSGTFTVTDLDLTDNVSAAVDSVAVSGTGASSVPGSLTNAMLRNFLTVTPTAVLNGTQTTNTLTWNFNSGSEAFSFLATGETLVLNYTVSATDDDGSPLSDTETVTITIAGVGNAPVITGGPATSLLTETNTGLTDSGTLTVSDLDTSDTVTATVASVTVGGSGVGRVPISLTNETLLNFLSVTPTEILDEFQNSATLTWNFISGSEAFNFLATGQTLVFTYTVNAIDSDGSSDTEMVIVTVTGTNDVPVAVSDEYTTSYIDDLIVGLPGVLGNDSDVDGDAISVVLVQGPASGTATLLADGSLRYQPQPGFVGTATIVYYVTDGSLNSNEQTVSIQVTVPTNLPPPEPDNGGGGGTNSDGPPTTSTTSNAASGTTAVIGRIEQETQATVPNAAVATIVIEEASTSRGLGAGEANFGITTESTLFNTPVGMVFNAPTTARLELAESNRLQLKQSQSLQMIFAQSEQQMQEEMKQDWFSQVDPFVATAFGTGMVIWLVHAGKFAAALLSTASTWVQLDPLTVLQGTKELDLAATSEEKLFEDKVER